jgi:hypothetical protein
VSVRVCIVAMDGPASETSPVAVGIPPDMLVRATGSHGWDLFSLAAL